MRWQPEQNEEEERQVRTGYISDQTAYMRMQTEMEKKDDFIDKEFLKKHKPRILALDKFAPLSFSPDSQVKIDRIRRIKLDLLEEAGLHEEAINCALDNIGDYQSFRGVRGNFQLAQITERHEIKQEASNAEKRAGFMSRGLFGRKKPEEEEARLTVEQ
jgi:hypothetical protein